MSNSTAHSADEPITSIRSLRNEVRLKGLPQGVQLHSGSQPCSLSHNDDGHGLREDIHIVLPSNYGELHALLGPPVLELPRTVAAGMIRVLTGHEVGHVLDTIDGLDPISTGANPRDVQYRRFLHNVVDDIAIDCGLIDDRWPALVHLQPLLHSYLWAMSVDFGEELTDPATTPAEYVKLTTYAWLYWARCGAIKVHGNRAETLPDDWAQPFFEQLKQLVPELIDSVGQPAERHRLFEAAYDILRSLGLEARNHRSGASEPGGSQQAAGTGAPSASETGEIDLGNSTDTGTGGSEGNEPGQDSTPGAGEGDEPAQGMTPQPDTDGAASTGGTEAATGAGTRAAPDPTGSRLSPPPGTDDGDEPARGTAAAVEPDDPPSGGINQQAPATSSTAAPGIEDAELDLDEPMTAHDNTLGGSLDHNTPTDDVLDAVNEAAADLGDVLERINEELAEADRLGRLEVRAAAARAMQDEIGGIVDKPTWQDHRPQPIPASSDLQRRGRSLAGALRTLLRQAQLSRGPRSEGTGVDLTRPHRVGLAVAGVPDQPIWRAPLREVTRPEGVDTVIVLDVSGSMDEEGAWLHARRAVETLAAATVTLPEVRLGLVAFAADGYPVRHLDDPWGPPGLASLLGELSCILGQDIDRYDTHVAPAIEWAAAELRRARRPRCRGLLVVVTDGQFWDEDQADGVGHSEALAVDGVIRVAVAFPGADIETIAPLVDVVVDLRDDPSQLGRTLHQTLNRVIAGRPLARI